MSVIWGFDRLARILSIAIARPRRAKVTELGGEYVRIDIPGIRWDCEPGKHVYIYFPPLHPLSPLLWENHPFLILQTALPQKLRAHSGSDSNSQSSVDRPDEQQHGIEKLT